MKLTKNKSIILSLVIILNLAFFINLWYINFYNEITFDSESKVEIDCSVIDKVTVRNGSWDSANLDVFNSPFVFSNDKHEKICLALSESIPFFLKNDSPQKGWFECEIQFLDKKDIKFLIGCNSENEVFLEFEGVTYKGKRLSAIILSELGYNS